MKRRCPFCCKEMSKGQEMFLRIVQKGFFVFEHRIDGKKHCQRALKNIDSVEDAKMIMRALGM